MNGNINQFVRANEEVNRFELVSFFQDPAVLTCS